jgi:hypothetical protein
MMTYRERILAVYRGETPDVVPYMLDLSHWFYHKFQKPWDLSRAFTKPETELIAYHRSVGAGFYIANLASFYNVTYANGVRASLERIEQPVPTIAWTLETPLGTIRRTRVWEEESYSWAIRDWAVQSEADLRILAHALGSRQFTPAWDRYRQWVEEVGDLGVVYVSPSYTAIGELLSLWMGIEGTMFAAADWSDTMHEVVEQINVSWLRLVDVLAQGPAEIVLLHDNFSSDIQSPRVFQTWSRQWYAEAVKRLHQAGKFAAVHVDGRLRGLLREFAGIGMDCIDATTPAPMGDLTPQQCRDEAGPNLILSGGVPPNVWTHDVSDDVFEKAVLDWLELRSRSPRLIANAGDQVPPHACEHRILLMRELVEKFGRY